VIESRLILITLLIKLGVAAAVSSALARARTFQNLLLTSNRTPSQTLGLLAFVCIPLGLGVWVRLLVPNFFAADISFETTIILGVLLGPFSALTGAVVLSLPAMLHHEYLSLPFNLAVAIIAGLYGKFVEEEEVWSFSPFVDLSIYRWIRRNLPRPRLFDWQIMFFTTIIGLRFVQTEMARYFSHSIFSMDSSNLWVEVAIYAASAMAIGIELKIFNSVRIQIKLEEQERLLLHARMEALQNQINPHFLFNTLNSISSLVRFDPDTAREVISKLATILRRLLSSADSFVPLREEVEFIDNYLDIEVVRFGKDKLRVVKELAPESLDVMVPSMLLQPLVENSIKHGLASKVEGGSIFLRSRLSDSRLVIEVEDDGVGIAATQTPESGNGRGAGIGMANVSERLQVLYGDTARLTVDSHEGKGTLVRIRLPLLQTAGAVPEGFYDERSTMRR